MSSCGLDFATSNTTLGTIIGDIPVLRSSTSRFGRETKHQSSKYLES
jgi:hypothetical protein